MFKLFGSSTANSEKSQALEETKVNLAAVMEIQLAGKAGKEAIDKVFAILEEQGDFKRIKKAETEKTNPKLFKAAAELCSQIIWQLQVTKIIEDSTMQAAMKYRMTKQLNGAKEYIFPFNEIHDKSTELSLDYLVVMCKCLGLLLSANEEQMEYTKAGLVQILDETRNKIIDARDNAVKSVSKVVVATAIRDLKMPTLPKKEMYPDLFDKIEQDVKFRIAQNVELIIRESVGKNFLSVSQLAARAKMGISAPTNNPTNNSHI